MREIVLDTETTGLSPEDGHRIVEIGCVELINHVVTDRPEGKRQFYINPERSMPAEAFEVHGLSDEFLAEKPVFAEIAEDFLDFIAEAPLIIHNAEFDMKFLNAELRRLGLPALPRDRAIDTLAIARKRFPGAQASLDALCKRYDIDNTGRTLHGALLDSTLLAEVYLELIGGRQPGFSLAEDTRTSQTQGSVARRTPRPARPHAPSQAELDAHAAMLDRLANPIWRS